ncbi:MAG: HAD-IB family phosphatase [Candidatus Eisenbacteria bacterium]
MTPTDPVGAEPTGLVVFDLDGTLLCGPTVCEILAEPLGRGAAMRRFEGLSSEPDIAKSRVVMASWYRGIPLEKLCDPLKRATWRPGVNSAIALLREAGIEVAIATMTWRFAAKRLAERIGVSRVLGTELGQDEIIGHVWPRDKGDFLRALSKELGVPQQRTAAVGDSLNDTFLLTAASLRFFVGEGTLPTGLDVRHKPSADMLSIAREVVECWSVGRGDSAG